jgi:hypothetical protein
MNQVLTLAEGRALLAQQKGGKKPGFAAPAARKPPERHTDTPKPAEAGRAH